MNNSRVLITVFCLMLGAIFGQLLPSVRAADDAPVFLSAKRLAEIRARIQRQTAPTYSAFELLRKDADAALTRQPQVPENWSVPPFYKDKEAHRAAKGGLLQDANAAYALALAYALTGEERYAAAAARFVMAWTTLKTLDTVADSKLAFSYHFPALILAADLIRHSPAWTPANDAAFGEFLRAKALPMNTMKEKNNWANWGVVLVASAGAYLHDAALLDSATQRWKELLEDQVDEQGALKYEVHRNGDGAYGIWYSHFSLMAATITAEIARVHGTDLYSYRSPAGRSLRQAFDRLAPWAHDPRSFPYYKGADLTKIHLPDYVSYFEVLNARWPNPDASAMLKARRPLTADHATPYLTLTHGDLDPEL